MFAFIKIEKKNQDIFAGIRARTEPYARARTCRGEPGVSTSAVITDQTFGGRSSQNAMTMGLHEGL